MFSPVLIRTVTVHSQTQTELNEKLQECYTKLFQAGADQRESERETKLKETLSNLQRSMPGMFSSLLESPR